MASQTSLIQVILKANDQASATINRVGGSLTKLAKFGAVGAAVGAVAGAVAGYAAAIASVVKAANAQENAEIKLANALRNTGQSVQQQLPRLVAQATALQKITTASDDAILSGQTWLVTLGKLSGDTLDRATRAALDMAAVTGNVDEAFKAVAKAAAGKTRILNELGLAYKLTGDKARDTNAILTLIESRFGGQAQAQARSFEGALTQLGNAWDDLKESLGRFIIQTPELHAALSELTRLLFNVGAALDALQTSKLFQLLRFVIGWQIGLPALKATNELLEAFTPAADTTSRVALNAGGALKQFGDDAEEAAAKTAKLKAAVDGFNQPATVKGLRDLAEEAFGEATATPTIATIDKIREAFAAMQQALAKGQLEPSRFAVMVEGLENAADAARELGFQIDLSGTGLERVTRQITDLDVAVARLQQNFTVSAEEFIIRLGEQARTLTDLSLQFYQEFSTGISQALGDLIIRHRDAAETLRQMLKNMAQALIDFLIGVLVQQIAVAVAGSAVAAKQHIGRMAQLAAQTYGAAFAAIAAIPFVGPALAPAAAAGAVAAMLAGSSGAFAAGAGVGAGQTGAQGFARGGIVGGHGRTDSVPAWLTPGELVVDTKAGEARSVLDGRAAIVPAESAGVTIINNWNVLDGEDVRRVLTRHPEAFGEAYRHASRRRVL